MSGTYYSIIISVLLIAVSSATFFFLKKDGHISIGAGSISEITTINKKPTLFVAGPSNSGKSTLFGWLTTETLKNTVISQEPNVANDFLLESGDKIVKLIEFPGHLKLRYKLLNSLKNSTNIKGLMYVIDSTVDPKELVETAEFLYQILNITENRTHNGVKILIACNKSESFTARPPQKIKDVLELEITEIIKRKKQSLGTVHKAVNTNNEDEENATENEQVLDSLKVFKFDALEGNVTVLDGSVTKNKLNKWKDWMHDAINQ